MEEKQPGQRPERDQRGVTDATAARTRPIDALPDPPADPSAARAAKREADIEVDRMKARGFGSHKGTEAD